MSLELEDVKNYLKIDNAEENNFLTDLISASQIYIDSCVGEDYKTDIKAVKLSELVQKKIICDLYENRSTTVTDKTKQDRIVTTILDKLSYYSGDPI